MIFTSSASGSDELLRPSLAATRVQQASAFSGRPRDARRGIVSPDAQRTLRHRRATARRRKVIEEAHQQRPPARVNVKHGREVENDRAGDGHDEARYY